ncbi:MAG: colanic acid biosynthesis glycosyltransferase WcaL [Micrococcales bacterium]|nr:MAG: colanic acid biosynthesis glycosyltransferase WcaL [Micrococcales bacterium]
MRSHWQLLRRDPRTYTGVLAQALRTGEPRPKTRLWQVFYFAEAVVLHDLMSHRQLRHVHAHFANNGADVARLTALIGQRLDGPRAGWKWTFTMHGPTEFEAVDRFDLPAKVRSADGVACISDFCRSQLMRMVEPNHWDKLAMIRMSVDTDKFTPPPAVRDHPGDERMRVLYVGRLVPEKGSPVLLDAVADLTRRGVPLQVKLVGSGELEPQLVEQVRRDGLTDVVELVGAVGQDDLPALYHWADVFVLPSFQEGLPVVLMEAMATQLPVVTTQIAAISELVEDATSGRVLPPGRADLLAEALAELAADPVTRQKMGEAGRETVVSQFTSDRSATALIGFFEQSKID